MFVNTIKILLFGLFLTCFLVAETDQEKSTLIKTGDMAPSFNFTTLDGQNYSSESLQGKVVLINFFATWCGPCNAEIPHLIDEVYEKIEDEDFFMVGIGREHVADTLRKFVDKKEIFYPITADPERKIYGKFAQRYIPRNVVIGKDSKVLYESVGFDQEEFDKMIEVIREELE
ncbi:MAG: TlpA family protein disulfide reductase [Fidelibacterota bacterium]